jgi:hypothetical protein
MQLKTTDAPRVVRQITCDRCGREAVRGERDFSEMTSIDFFGDRDSIFGYQNRVEIDLCEVCLRATLGTWLRVTSPWDIGQMPPGDGIPATNTQGDHARGHMAHLYGVLTVDEMAARMKCTPEDVREREAAGEIFSACAPGRENGPRYPAFQLDYRLNKVALKRIILEYQKWNTSTTLMWSFLRSRQKIFGGLTPVEMMLGGSTPNYDALTPDEWNEEFLDVVSEELSRVAR